jgi:hypothetical protein
MRPFHLLACAGLALALLTGAAKKPDFTVRFHVETQAQDTERFAMPITLKDPPRSLFVERTPSISERHIAGVYPFQADDGSFGCVFRMDPDGRIALESLTTTHRGRTLVGFVGTKKGSHQVTDMIIDKPVRDGIITIPRGLTPAEVAMLKKDYKPALPKGATPPPKKGMKLPWTS